MRPSNFDFVQGTPFAKYAGRLTTSERNYIEGDYNDLAGSIRVVAEAIVKSDLASRNLTSDHIFFDNLRCAGHHHFYPQPVLDCFHRIRRVGNDAVHNVNGVQSSQDALQDLKDIFNILRFVMVRDGYSEATDQIFEEPKRLPLEQQVKDLVGGQGKSPFKSAEKKLIYVADVDQKKQYEPSYLGWEKIGEASISDPNNDLTPNSDYLRKCAEKRIHSYMTTAGLPAVVEWAELAYSRKRKEWFGDRNIHELLHRSGIPSRQNVKEKGLDSGTGREWFKASVETAKLAIKAFKEGKQSLNPDEIPSNHPTSIVLRPEQQKAVERTIHIFDEADHKLARHGATVSVNDRTMLWFAKMRFGKTLTALELIKEKKYRRVIIVTHRPVVDTGWREDFNKLGMRQAGYLYGSKNGRELGEYQSVQALEQASRETGSGYVYFASLQDLTGSKQVGGKVGDKNRDVFGINWDLVIIDEAHEGTQTELASNVFDGLVSRNTKILQLSGTPFNLLTQHDYDERHVYTWDYVMEQQAKEKFELLHPDQPNPYEPLPKMSMYTFELGDTFAQTNYRLGGTSHYSFNFAEFFRVGEDERFVHEEDVQKFLNIISSPDRSGRTNYPFSTQQLRDNLRHTLWILPSRRAANALELLLDEHPVFGMYNIVNVVRDDTSDDIEEASDDDLNRVRKGITDKPWQSNSITLTVRKLTTGVTVPEWTGVLFLSNMTSAMQYLQAAFRVQSPYSSEQFGQKTNCYVFDFAPDRALTVLAESASISPQRGRATTKQQRTQLGQLLNFLPVLGMRGNQMRKFDVNALMGKIKQAFAERAVRTGFDDDSIYSDAFFDLTDDDVAQFDHLRGIIGTTKREKRPLKIDVNNQHLSDEERDRASVARKKKEKESERTPEEQAALDKLNALRKQRKELISTLRGVSIRIPLMIYGMDMPLDEDISIQDFIDRVDATSWQEFMPAGVTKAMFRQFTRFYDPDVFINAGRIIRQRVRELDDADVMTRVNGIADIFHSFRNPDKETVLTPWRVVNMHMARTLGGWCHFDENFETEFDGERRVLRRVMQQPTDKVFYPGTKILEINSKTGLYPLYIAASLYQDWLAEQAGKSADMPSVLKEQKAWCDILRRNIYIVAKTPMALRITQRTLVGFHDPYSWKLNINYFEKLIDKTRSNVSFEAEEIERQFNTMKFDVVIGNPPYQQPAKGASTRQEPVYHLFYQLAFKLADLVTLITPARFLFNVGQTPTKWNEQMLNDPHFKVVRYEKDGQTIFPHTDIKGGVAITLWDKNRNFGPIKVFTPYALLNSIKQKVWDNSSTVGSMSSIVSAQGLYRFTHGALHANPNIGRITGNGTGSKITSRIFAALPTNENGGNSTDVVTIFGLNKTQRVSKTFPRADIEANGYTDSWKVLVPEANGSGAFGEVLSSPFVAAPGTGNTDTFLAVGPFGSEAEAAAALKYMKTKFMRAMLGVKKITHHNPRATWEYVPLQDFGSGSEIHWDASIPEIDAQLYQKYGLTQEEIDFIEQNVKAME